MFHTLNELRRRIWRFRIDPPWGLNRKLRMAVSAGNEEQVLLLLAQGANIHSTDEYGETPLLFAAWSQNARMVSLLCQHGANPNDQSEFSALMRAVGDMYNTFPSLETVRALLEAGADVNAVCEGDTLLSYLRKAVDVDDNDEIVAILKEAGAQE